MNRAELIEALAQQYEGSKSEATKALNAVVQTITYTAAAGEKVAITGFGVFEKVDRPARMVRNPRTGERKEAPATSVPRFRPGTELKAYVAGERELPATTAAVAAPVRRRVTRASAPVPTAAPAEPAPVEPAGEVLAKPVKAVKTVSAEKPAVAKKSTTPKKPAASTKPVVTKKPVAAKKDLKAASSKAVAKKDSKASSDKKDSKGKKKDSKKAKSGR